MKSPNMITRSFILIVFVSSIRSSSCEPQDVLGWEKFNLQIPKGAIGKDDLKSLYLDGLTPYNFNVWRDKLFFALRDSYPTPLPISFGFVNLKDLGKTDRPKLFGYPEGDVTQFDVTNPGPESKLKHVRLLDVDVCDRLWLIDEGVRDVRGPRIMIYDLTTDRLIRKHEMFNETDHKFVFKSMNVDVTKEHCDKAHAYIMRQDGQRQKFLVYDFQEDVYFRTSLDLSPVDNPALLKECSQQVAKERSRLAASNFTIMKHPTLLAPKTDGQRQLYFTTNIDVEYAISTKALKTKPELSTGFQYELLGCRGYDLPLITSVSFDEKTGILLQSTSQNITCWNSAKHSKISTNTSGIYELEGRAFRVIKTDADENLWILTAYYTNEVLPYKMSKVPIAEVIAGAAC